MSTPSYSEHDQPHPQRLIVAITGATGAIYGVRLLQTLRQLPQIETHLIVSEAGWLTIAHELEMSKDEPVPLDEHHRLAWKPGAGWALEVVGLKVEP